MTSNTDKTQDQGITRAGRGEQQPKDKKRAQQTSGLETASDKTSKDGTKRSAPSTDGHS